MTKIIYFDCFSGISGDMALGALLDAGLSLDALRAELAKLGVDGWAIEAEQTLRGYLSGTRAHVHAPEQPVHRHLSDVRAIIERSTLAAPVKERSVAVFTLLAEAEGKVHGVSAEAVHFHEVGALDAIVDIVGVVAGLALLGVEQCYASALPLGSGWVRAAHGEIPVPAPAVLNILAAAHAPTLPDAAPAELVTPTGAALLAALATFARPAMRLARVGYGFGKRELERPNALRVWLGHSGVRDQGSGIRGQKPEAREGRSQESGVRSQESGVRSQKPEARDSIATGEEDSIEHPTPDPRPLIPDPASLVLLETNIDDQPAEQLAYAAERLFALGALDVWQTPIAMKKGRAATMLSALLPAEHEAAALTLILRETTTLGVRRRVVERHTCARELVSVETPLGAVRVKIKRWNGELLGAAPEYEDCARLARAHSLPLREVYRIVEQSRNW